VLVARLRPTPYLDLLGRAVAHSLLGARTAANALSSTEYRTLTRSPSSRTNAPNVGVICTGPASSPSAYVSAVVTDVTL
jgi:hypothetical protein